MIFSILIALLFGLMPGQKEPEAKPPAFRWLSASGEAAPVRLADHKLGLISISRQGSAAEAESETVPLGNGNTRKTTRTYIADPNGARVLVEAAIEEIHNFPGGRTEAVRTVSQRDINGRMAIVGKYQQETMPSGADSYQTTMTVQLAGPQGGALAPAEQVIQIERAKGSKEIEIDRTQLAPNAIGGWVTKERRSSNTQISSNQLSTEETVYSPDADGHLRLNARLSSQEWKDARGNEQREITTYRSDLQGRLNLDNRIQISREGLAGGAQQTTQATNEINPAAPSEGLRLTQKIVETIRPSSPNATERNVTVMNPDLNGQIQTIYTLRTIQPK
jgi:hypothetical protein